MMRWLLVIVIIAGACVSPPARPDACREDISIAYAREYVLWLADETGVDFDPRGRTQPPDSHQDWSALLLGSAARANDERDRAIERYITDRWPSRVVRCYLENDSTERCYTQLPQDKCLAVEHALHPSPPDGGGRCGEGSVIYN